MAPGRGLHSPGRADKCCQTVFVPLVPFCLLSLAPICVFGPGFGKLLTLMNIVNGGQLTLDQSAQQKPGPLFTLTRHLPQFIILNFGSQMT